MDIPIIIDINGPEIRIRAVQQKVFSKGDILKVGFDGEEISFNHDFYDEMYVDDEVYIDNEKIRTRVVEEKDRKLQLLILSGGVIEDRKGVNLPNKHLLIPTFPEKDLQIIRFAKKYDVEYIVLSFTRNAKDVKNLSQTSFGGGSNRQD